MPSIHHSHNIADHLQPQRPRSRLSIIPRCTHHPKARLWIKLHRGETISCREKRSEERRVGKVYTPLTQHCRSPTATTAQVPTTNNHALYSPSEGPSMDQITSSGNHQLQKKIILSLSLGCLPYTIHTTLPITYSHNGPGPDCQSYRAVLTIRRPVYGSNYIEGKPSVAEKKDRKSVV